MTTIEMPAWQLVSIAVTILGAFAGLVKVMVMQMERRLDQRFAITDKDSERLRTLEISFERLRGDMPVHYVRREDYVRGQTVIEAKLDALALKLENRSTKRTEAMNIDAAKTRRESLRWYIIKTLDTSRPVDPHEAIVLSTIQGIYPDATTMELRRELDYLADRSLVTLDKSPTVCGSAA